MHLKGFPLTIDLFLGKSLSKSRLIPIKYNLITVQIILLATQWWGSLNLNLFTYHYNWEQLQRCQTCVIITKNRLLMYFYRLGSFLQMLQMIKESYLIFLALISLSSIRGNRHNKILQVILYICYTSKIKFKCYSKGPIIQTSKILKDPKSGKEKKF